MQDTITIKFRAKGDDVLIQTIKKLDKATKALVKVQSQLVNEGKKQVQSQNKNAKQIESLRIKVKALGGEWSKNSTLLGLHKKALEGDKIAMQQLRNETSKYIVKLKQTKKGLFDSAHSSRILGGGFAVLRSKLLIASFAMATMIKPLTRLVKMAGDANETFNKTSVVFGKFSGAVKRWATDFGKSVGYSESTLLEFANTFQDTFVPLGFARVEAARFSTSLTKLALDVASFSNKMDADVVRDFQSAIVGNHETVRKYGVVIDDAIMKAKAYEMGIAEVGEELTASQKVLARFQVIISGSADAMGDKARTMGDYNNQLKTFQELTKKTGEELGRSLMPVATVLLKLASHFANPTLIKSYALAVGALTIAYLAASGAVKTFIVALKSSKIAMASTGIGLAIVAFGEIAAAVMRAREEQTKYNKTLADYQLLALPDLLKEQEALQRIYNKLSKEGIISTTTILNLETGKFETIKKLIPMEEEKLNLSKKALDLITQEILARKIAAGIIDDSATALGALDEAYAKTIDGQKLALELEIAAIKSKIKLNDLTVEQKIGFASLEAQLRALTPNYEDWVTGLEKTNAENEQQAEWIKKLIESNPKLAKAMGYVKDKEIELTAAQKETVALLQEQYDSYSKLGGILGSFGSTLSGLDFSAMDKLKEAMELDTIGNSAEALENQATLLQAQIEAQASFYGQMGQMAADFLEAENARNEQRIRSQGQRELEALRETLKYKRATDKKKKELEEEQVKATNKRLKKNFRAKQALTISGIWMDAIAASMKSVKGSWTSIGQPWFGIIMGLAASQTAMVASQKPPTMAQGGLIGGRLHAQGGTPIEAERGEYMMSRKAVEAVGVETMNKINQGNAMGNVNIQFTGNVLSQDFIEDEAIPMIKEAIRRGADIGVA